MSVLVPDIKLIYQLKHTTTLFAMSDHYILSREWELLLIKYRPIIMVGLWCYNQSGVTELLIMRDPHYGRMCFKSVKTLGALHVELLGFYPILT